MKIIKTLLLTLCLFVPFVIAGCANENQPQLATPANVEVNNGIVVFDAVKDAEVYTLAINDLTINFNASYSSSVEIINNKINYNATKLFKYGKTYQIKLKAAAKEMKESKYSSVVTYTHNQVLEMPTNIKVVSNSLTWNVVESASYYMVKADHLTSGETETFKCDINSCSLSAVVNSFGAGEYAFSVKAVRTGTIPANSDYTSPVEYVYNKVLETPTISNIYLGNGKIYMQVSVDNFANSLSVVCNNSTKNVKLNGTDANVSKVGSDYKINLSGLFGTEVDELKQYTFKVQAKYETNATNYYKNSAISADYTFDKTETLIVPTLSLSYNSQTGTYLATWQKVNNAKGYVLVVVNGTAEKEYTLGENDTSMSISGAFTKVKIKAVGVGNYLDSAYSALISK